MESIEAYWGVTAGAMAAVLFIVLIIYLIITSIQLWIARIAATRNPTEANAWRVYKMLCRFGSGINNHPENWKQFRDMFYQINISNQVPSELKELIKQRLIKKGLYIHNMRIVDNYKGGK